MIKSEKAKSGKYREFFEAIKKADLFAILSHVKSLPHIKLFSITLKQHIGPIRWHRIEVTSPVLP